MKHEWTAFITLKLTDDEVERLRLTGQLHMANINEQRANSGTLVGCMRCERQLAGESASDIARLVDSPCPGEPTGYAADGAPLWG